MDQGYSLEMGKSPAKITSRDTLLWIMRGIIADSSGDITRQEAVARWRERLADHPDFDMLLDQIEEHYGLLLFQRCAVPVDDTKAKERSETFRRQVRETIASQIVLSTWVLPVVGKPLLECTFSEVSEAAPIAGKFLAKLALEGAPGTFVREVFKTEADLQEFWRRMQK